MTKMMMMSPDPGRQSQDLQPPCAARAAGVAHNPPLERQASWHQCLTECQRVEQLVSAECAQRMKSHADRFAERWEGLTKSRAYHVTSLAATLLAL